MKREIMLCYRKRLNSEKILFFIEKKINNKIVIEIDIKSYPKV